MIVTVTMNPAIDKTVEIDRLIQGGLNRIKSVEYDAGGKGINVSKTIFKLGGNSVATGFLGGNNGKTINDILSKTGIICDFINVDGETRTNTKVYEKSGNLTELNEPGPIITDKNINELLSKLNEYANDNTLFVLSGSVPKGVDKNIYAKIINMVHSKKASVLLDADGELLKNGIDAIPDIIKPNCAELAEYMGLDNLSDSEILSSAQRLYNKGIKTVAVSMGDKGAVVIKNGCKFQCPALKVDAHSTVGAGDAMAAALAYSWENKLSDEETLKLCIAVSAGAVTTKGTKPPELSLVNKLIDKVVINKY